MEFDTLFAMLRRQHQTICSPLCYVGVCWFSPLTCFLVCACFMTRSDAAASWPNGLNAVKKMLRLHISSLGEELTYFLSLLLFILYLQHSIPLSFSTPPIILLSLRPPLTTEPMSSCPFWFSFCIPILCPPFRWRPFHRWQPCKRRRAVYSQKTRSWWRDLTSLTP